MVYDTQNYWVFGFRSSSGILEQCCPAFLCTRAQFTDAYGGACATTLLLLLLLLVLLLLNTTPTTTTTTTNNNNNNNNNNTYGCLRG
jgi:hypothetical protein